jgi:hypothetical protein
MNIVLNLRLFSKRFLQLQFIVIFIIVLLSFLGQLCRYFGLNRRFGLGFFFVDAEANIPTWYSSALLLLCAIILFAIALIQAENRERYVRQWQFLAFIFLCLSIDETASFHEQMNAIGYIIKLKGLFYYTWVIPAIFLVSIFVLFYLRFLAQLHPKTRRLFWLSGIIYLTGAIGFEMLGGVMIESSDKNGLAYIICYHFEEGLEFLGVTVFLYTLLNYLHSNLQNVSIHFDGKN